MFRKRLEFSYSSSSSQLYSIGGCPLKLPCDMLLSTVVQLLKVSSFPSFVFCQLSSEVKRGFVYKSDGFGQEPPTSAAIRLINTAQFFLPNKNFVLVEHANLNISFPSLCHQGFYPKNSLGLPFAYAKWNFVSSPSCNFHTRESQPSKQLAEATLLASFVSGSCTLVNLSTVYQGNKMDAIAPEYLSPCVPHSCQCSQGFCFVL